MPIASSTPFKGRHCPRAVILACVRSHPHYPLAYAHVAELIRERGQAVDASGVWLWVQVYGPELERRCRPYLKPTTKSYRVDETRIRVTGKSNTSSGTWTDRVRRSTFCSPPGATPMPLNHSSAGR